MPMCQYEIWKIKGNILHKNSNIPYTKNVIGGFDCCGEEAKEVSLPKSKYARSRVCLCPEHLAFVVDCIDRADIINAKEAKKREKKIGFDLC